MVMRNQIVEVMSRHGMDVACYDETFLGKSLDKRVAFVASPSVEIYLDWLAGNRAEAIDFFASLDICYSEFFRNPLAFVLLEQMILPGLINELGKSGRTELRIWSAGCAAGQEPYSLAILLEDLAVARGAAIPFRIFATDGSETALAAACRGVYEEATVQNVCLRRIHSYFSRQGESYVFDPRIKARIDFSVYDLLDPHSVSPPTGIYGDFDLVFCSNLLFYYKLEVRCLILNKIRRSLSENGYFITGEAEKTIVEQAGGFRAVVPPAAVFRKVGE